MRKRGGRGAAGTVLYGVIIGIGFSVGCGGDHTGAAGIGGGGAGGAASMSGAAGDTATAGTGGAGTGMGGVGTGAGGAGTGAGGAGTGTGGVGTGAGGAGTGTGGVGTGAGGAGTGAGGTGTGTGGVGTGAGGAGTGTGGVGTGAGGAGTGAGGVGTGAGGVGTGAGGVGTGAGGAGTGTGGAQAGTGGVGGTGTGIGGTGGGTGTGTAGAGGGGGTAGAGGGLVPPATASWLVNGGDAPSGVASAGGVIHVVAQGAVTLGASAPTAPTVPAPAADAVVADGAALQADLTAAASVRIDGAVIAGGGEAVRQITSTGGDIFVSGTLSGGGAGGAVRGLTLNAPNGTVYVTGAVETSGTAAGQGGGPIVIAARRVVLLGALSANGADGASGGNAGGITIVAADLVYFGGPIQARGGAGMSAGGRGGKLVIDTVGAVQGANLIDARGGAGAGVGATAGAAGEVHVGEQQPPSQVNVAVPLYARGGAGGATGGPGGEITIEPQNGNLVVAGVVDFGGGDARTQPGKGGSFVARIGAGVGDRAVDGGGVMIAGQLSGNGGGVVAGGAGNGGVAGLVDVEPVSLLGALVVTPAASVTLDGGASGGAGIAGGGGHLYLITKNGDLTIGGKLSLRGGNAPDIGGTGGLGGAVDIFSDANFDGFGGNLLIETTGVIDASGGTGTIGGSGRNNGGAGAANFPDEIEMIAVLINCDGIHGSSANWLENRGWIIARGGAANGNGGDIVYHGISPDRDSSPPSGNIDNAASGTGRPGDYGAE